MLVVSKIPVRIVAMMVFTVCLLAGARAGDYHYGKTLKCDDCHATHGNDVPGDNKTGSARNLHTGFRASNPAEVADLCLRCHNNQPGIPDVVGADINNPGESYDGTERAGGRFPETSSESWKGHNPPGLGATSAGDCTACHYPHGNSNYRNLRGSSDSEEGPVAFVNPSATGLDKYRRSNVGYSRNISDRLCGRCHSSEPSGNSGMSGGGATFHIHPTSGQGRTITVADSGQEQARHWTAGVGSGFSLGGSPVARVPFGVSPAGSFGAATTIAANNEVMCLSCHKAHGSVHAFGMIWPYGGPGSNGLVGSTGCNQCHNISE